MKKIFAILAAMPLMAAAQPAIDFETQNGYSGISVYDVWPESPFRTGILTGNFAVVDNPDTGVNEVTGVQDNASAKVLGAQRSRFGSNRFGVRVDLAEPWATNTTTQYVHVMLNKPIEGRVMLVGLGSREERKGQNPYAEQFWQLSTSTVGVNGWYDAVFPIRTSNGVNIRSLVIVPDCESPHALTDDFLFYVDNIVVNDQALPRINKEFYPIAGDKLSASMSRNDRYTSNVYLKGNGARQSVSVPQKTTHKLYHEVADNFFFAKPGQTLTPELKYTGSFMHAYCYVDLNNNGQFDDDECVAYNYYQGKNSLGEDVNQNLGSNIGKMPSFTLPATMAPGVYRMRYKVDWDCIDSRGNSASDNTIAGNGGSITDIMLCVYGDQVTLNDFQLNGEILAGDGAKLSDLKVPADAEFIIKSAPEVGFRNGGVDVKCGYNLNGDGVDKFGNPQFFIWNISADKFDANGCYTIPAAKMRGNMLFNGNMLQSDIEDGITEVETSADKTADVYNLQGVKVNKTQKGHIYVSKGSKFLKQ